MAAACLSATGLIQATLLLTKKLLLLLCPNKILAIQHTLR